jgi:DNA polymerase-3 subunit delta'
MIVGHKKIIRYLEQVAAGEKKLGHAYLFSGPESIGKKTIALNFARMLLCGAERPAFGGCGSCDSCVMAASGIHPGIIIISPEKKEGVSRSTISIDEIRQLRRKIKMNPYDTNKHTVAIIDDAHIMETPGFNALLKTLEEPPARSLIILISSQLDLFPKTILSRVQHVRFSPVSKRDIEAYINDHGSNDIKKQKEHFVRHPALLFTKNVLTGGEYEAAVAELNDFLLKPLHEKYAYVEATFADNEDSMDVVLDAWIEAARDLLHRALKGEKIGVESQKMVKTLRHLIELRFAIKHTNVNKKLVLDAFVLSIK